MPACLPSSHASAKMGPSRHHPTGLDTHVTGLKGLLLLSDCDCSMLIDWFKASSWRGMGPGASQDKVPHLVFLLCPFTLVHSIILLLSHFLTSSGAPASTPHTPKPFQGHTHSLWSAHSSLPSLLLCGDCGHLCDGLTSVSSNSITSPCMPMFSS